MVKSYLGILRFQHIVYFNSNMLQLSSKGKDYAARGRKAQGAFPLHYMMYLLGSMKTAMRYFQLLFDFKGIVPSKHYNQISLSRIIDIKSFFIFEKTNRIRYRIRSSTKLKIFYFTNYCLSILYNFLATLN